MLTFLTIPLIGHSQRIFQLNKPQHIHLEAPYKGTELRYLTYHYDINSNVHTNSVSDLHVDQYGRIWFASFSAGFTMIDGYDLYTYGKLNGLEDRYSDVFVDQKGNVWAGGNGIGAVKLEDGLYCKWYVKYGEDISDVHIQNFNGDSEGNVWISTRLGGLTCMKEDTAIFYTPDTHPLLTSTFTHDLTIDKNDVVWFNDHERIFYIKNEELKEYDFKKFGIENFHKFYGGGENPVVLVDKNSRMFEITTSSATPIEIEFIESTPKKVNKPYFDREGNLFLHCGKSIYKVEDGKAFPIVTEDANIDISDMVFDLDNSLWFGSKTQGLFYIPDLDIIRFSGYTARRPFKNGTVITDNDGWVRYIELGQKNGLATNVPLFKMKENRFKQHFVLSQGIFLTETGFTNPKYFDTALVENSSLASFYQQFSEGESFEGLDVLIRKDEEVFAGLGKDVVPLNIKSKGAKIFHKEDNRYYIWLEQIRNEKYSMGYYEDGEFNLMFDSLTMCNLRDTIEVGATRLTAFHYVNDTTFLVGTWGAFMYKITPNTCTNMPDGFGTSIVYGYKADPKGNLWIGGIEGGLNYVDAQTNFVFNINETHGLKGSAARNNTALEDGSVLCGTNIGLGIFHCKVPHMPVNSEEDFFEKYELQFYSPKDGLIGEVFGHLKKDVEGRIWFTNRLGVEHVIVKSPKDISPSHLYFEHIYLIEEDESTITQYFHSPGTPVKDPTKLEIEYGEDLHIKTKAIYFKNTFAMKYQWRLNDENWNLPQRSPEFALRGLPSGDHTLHFRAFVDENHVSNEVSIKISIAPPFYQTTWFIVLIILLGGGIFYGIYRWRTHIMRMRQKVLERTVEERTEEINLAKIEIETQHSEIKDSIAYAKRIQEAILPANDVVRKCLPQSFILYKPKDIVAGDFYWLEDMGDTVVFAAADCTGHGVPGAMVSVVCHNALNRAVREFNITDPQLILDKTRELVLEKFETGKREVSDGMDIAVCSWNKKTNELTYAGANNSLYHVRQGELIEIKADKQPIGKFHDPKPFTAHSIKLEKNDAIYIFTDGFADQFGGDKGKKFKSTHFKKLLESLFATDITSQRMAINDAFNEWKGELEQVDDVCVIGIRV